MISSVSPRDSRLTAAGRVVLATRGSPLALVQANLVRDLLLARDAGLSVAVEAMRTTGDKFLDRPLAEIGGKGLFTKELDEALLDGRADFAVHSMKDLPTHLPDGLALAVMLEREDPRDVWIGRNGAALADLPAKAVVGTASLRRGAQILHCRPDLRTAIFRGNVQTRLKKLAAGEADATLLALAGLHRLGMKVGEGDLAGARVLDMKDMLPAPAQGAIGIVCRTDDAAIHALLAPLAHAATMVTVSAERAALEALDGSCRTPIAAFAETDGVSLSLQVAIFSPDGAAGHRTARSGLVQDAVAMGLDAGGELRRQAGPNFFAGMK
ncbi:MAG TPA: hydroxymethylbilane synthase [Alphaproteobacteria bacterium]|jgi:hydroxymethylbilane synthase